MRIFFHTDKNAPMLRIVSISVKDIEKMSKVNRRAKFHEELPEKAILSSVHLAGRIPRMCLSD